MCPSAQSSNSVRMSTENQNFTSPSSVTLLEAITKHFYAFSIHNGMSKGALSDILQKEKNTLPAPNILPGTYAEAKKLIQHLLMPLKKYEVCINDCLIFKDRHAETDHCPKCLEPRR